VAKILAELGKEDPRGGVGGAAGRIGDNHSYPPVWPRGLRGVGVPNVRPGGKVETGVNGATPKPANNVRRVVPAMTPSRLPQPFDRETASRRVRVMANRLTWNFESWTVCHRPGNRVQDLSTLACAQGPRI
jgi:hypothetical protein